jgi:catechol 2,3-dioxygenase-like lactoylglutathione lyase family enzyme
MSGTQVRNETAIVTPRARTLDMKLEVVVIPVSDVDRAKRFYGDLGWRLDADFVVGDEFRAVQTPPGSSCSIYFGKGVTSAVPGSAQRLYLIVSDIEAARAELVDRGAEVSEVFHRAVGEGVEKLVLVPAWREGGALFDKTERSALASAETVTRVAETAAVFDQKQLADLTLAIGLMNHLQPDDDQLPRHAGCGQAIAPNTRQDGWRSESLFCKG